MHASVFVALLFLVTPCLSVAVQPWMEWIPIKKKKLDVFYIYFFGQWFVKIKLKKLSILTCEFVSSFVVRYWYKMVATPCSRHVVFGFAKQFRSAWTLTLSSWITPKKCDGRNFSLHMDQLLRISIKQHPYWNIPHEKTNWCLTNIFKI